MTTSVLMRMLSVSVMTLVLGACHSLREPPPFPTSPPTQTGDASPQPGEQPEQVPPVVEQPEPPLPQQPAPKRFRLSTASAALVQQARTQAAGGSYAQAAATIERALRIEPANPLLWIELGKIRQAERNYAQADGMARKALALASTDTDAQSAAWSLIAESLRARGRNQEAAEAERRAAAPALR